MEKQTSDNLSCIVIGLDGLEKFLKNKSTKEKVNNSLNNFKKISKGHRLLNKKIIKQKWVIKVKSIFLVLIY